MTALPNPPGVPRGLLALGAVLLAAGVFLAFRILPEWEAPPPGGPVVLERARAEAAALGGTLTKPQASLRNHLSAQLYERAYRVLGYRDAAPYLVETGGAVAWRVTGQLEVTGAGSGNVEMAFARNGALRRLEWQTGAVWSIASPDAAIAAARERVATAALDRLAGGDARRGEEYVFQSGNAQVKVWPLVATPGRPREGLVRVFTGASFLIVSRELSDSAASGRYASGAFRGLAIVLPVFGGLCLFIAVRLGLLLFRRRLDFRIAFRIGAVAIVAMLLAGSLFDTGSSSGFVGGLAVGGRLLMVALLVLTWAVSESTLRDTVPGFTTSLDTLLSGRLGPRLGRAILGGLGAGAAIAGAKLLMHAAAAAGLRPGLFPEQASFNLPLFGGLANPFLEGPWTATFFILFAAIARWVLPKERADVFGAVGYAALYSTSFLFSPWLATLLFFLVEGAFLLYAFRTFGFTSLLVAATAAPLFRDAFVSGRLAPGNAVPLLICAGSLAALAAIGWLAARRPEKDDEAKVAAPEYVKRLESERRVQYEMDLLSRMQLALLPERPPDVAGLDIAVRTVLATEAGGDLYDFFEDEAGEFWLAAGDVSGHGYSCGIQQAMVKAALASLVKAGRSPGEILVEVDRVLRMGRARLFTSLTLLRIDPKTGLGVVANAGHPFPLIVVEGRCRELALPGLPLGMGPKRTYADNPFEIPDGGTLLIASDGLYEGPNGFDEPYGFVRPGVVLESVGIWRRPADAIVEALFTDWRRHVGEEPPADDTTIVALKRPSLSW